MEIHEYSLRSGITRTPEFERKKLASHAVNVGLKCGQPCMHALELLDWRRASAHRRSPDIPDRVPAGQASHTSGPIAAMIAADVRWMRSSDAVRVFASPFQS